MTVDDIPNQGEPIYKVTTKKGFECRNGACGETVEIKMEVIGYKPLPLPWMRHAD